MCAMAPVVVGLAVGVARLVREVSRVRGKAWRGGRFGGRRWWNLGTPYDGLHFALCIRLGAGVVRPLCGKGQTGW